MASEQVRIVLTAQDNASAVINNVTNSADNLFRRITTGIGQGIGQQLFFQASNMISRGFGMATDAVIGFNASLEQSKIAWTTMLGSAAASDKMIADLQEFAAQAGSFEFPDLERSARQILAMGFNANQVLPTIKAIATAGASLGLGSEGVGRLTLALGQMRATGRVTGEEMRQLTEAGIPAWDILAKAIGKPVGEVRKLSETGKISADVFINAFMETYGPMGKFGSLLEEQAKTFNGAMSNMTDAVRLRLGRAFEPVFKAIRDLALAITTWLTSDTLKQWAEDMYFRLSALSQAIQMIVTNVNVLKVVAAALAPVVLILAYNIGVHLVRAMALATLGMIRFAAAVLLANLPLTVLGAVIAGIALVIISSWEDVGPVVSEAVTWISDRLLELATWLTGEFVPGILSALHGVWDQWVNEGITALNNIGEAWTTFWAWFGQSHQQSLELMNTQSQTGWQNFVDIVLEAIRKVVGAWNNFVRILAQIQEASGGVAFAGLPIFKFLAGKEINVGEEALTSFGNTLKGIPNAVGPVWERLGKFVSEGIPTAVGRALDTLGKAKEFLTGIDIEKMMQDLRDAAVAQAAPAGEAVGQALGQGMMKAAKPLIEELAKLIAERIATPAREALEDTQYRLREIELELGVRGLLSPEERRAARAEARSLERFVLPGQELEAHRAERGVTLADRALQNANRERAILENIREQQEQAAGIAQGLKPGTTTGGAITGATGAPTAVTGAPTAAVLAAKEPTKVQLTLAVVFEGGQPTTIYEELIEANGQAITPPVIPVSGVRRA